VSLEYADADAVTVFLPYRKKLLGRIAYGELFATAASSRIFGGSWADARLHALFAQDDRP